MIKSLLIACLALISTVAFSQTTVTFHQSNLPFLGVNHQFGERFIPEFRVGTDQYLDDISVELVANYIFKQTDRFEFYGGVGPRIGSFASVVIPVGLNIYPFEQKDFGFHIEGTPMINFNAGSIFRGSFGIRYRFAKN
jgi:membrane protein CcdC involved in cytochrome C biogenesis